MSFTIRLLIWFKSNFVGSDSYGNRYYEEKYKKYRENRADGAPKLLTLVELMQAISTGNKGINKLTHPKKVKQRILIKINKDLQSKILRQDLVAAKKKKFKLYYSIRTCKSIRHMKKYPIRGQRTHTNAKTKKRMNVRV